MDELSQIIVFSTIDNPEIAKNNLTLFLDIAGVTGAKDKEFSKQKTKQFFSLMETHLQSKSTPKSKFYSLYMIKLIIQQQQNKILSVLASHSLLKYFHQLAKTTDPNKPITEKGSNLFPDKQLGNDYIRLMLECMKLLAEKSKSSNHQPTKFKKLYDQLIELKIVLPKQFKFFSEGVVGSNKTSKKISFNTEVLSGQKNHQQIKETKDTPNAKISDSNFAYKIEKQEIEISLNKINTFIEVLKTEDDQQSLRQQCQMYHKRFLKQQEKYQQIIKSVDYSKQEEVQMLLALNDFYIQQSKFYQKNIANQKDYATYIFDVLRASQIMHENIEKKKSKISTKYLQKDIKQSESTVKNRRINLDSGKNQNSELISTFLSQLNQKAKSPQTGFKSIKQSLSKQKSISLNSRNISKFKKSSVSKFGKSISKSVIRQTFATPPNLYPRDKNYQGQLIEKDKDLEKFIQSIDKNQGIRRFMACNFKEKNPLFENLHIQIGVKSKAIYEDANDFEVFIEIELYIGNKTSELIKNLSTSYKGNEDVLLYGNPRTIESVLVGGYQSKHELLVVPMKQRFPLIKMLLKYSYNDETIYENIILPNSIIKLASHGSLDNRQFNKYWKSSMIYRTNQFKWTRIITPDSFYKYIKTIQGLTSYQKFLTQGSQIDYELGCQVIIKQRHEGVLKICIRPNFNAIIQVGVIQNNEEAIESFKFYAQTLEALLTHSVQEQL